MLYLESPAGSGGSSGFSQCLRAGKPVPCCWDDKTQGVAYGHTLLAFFKAFPELYVWTLPGPARALPIRAECGLSLSWGGRKGVARWSTGKKPGFEIAH